MSTTIVITIQIQSQAEPEADAVRCDEGGTSSVATNQDVLDVAAYILQQRKRMTTMKLQKLVYYSQAWSLVWDERPLFENHIEAWAAGPVVPDLYNAHKGKFWVERSEIKGNPDALDAVAKETVDVVLGYYGDESAQRLSDLTHMEAPWKNARGDLPFGVPSHEVITWEAMASYYGSLPPDTE